MRPKVGLSVLPDDDLRMAQLPLFTDGLVEAVEWTLDAEFDETPPTWIERLLDYYASAGVLYGHGVQFSPLSAIFEPRQAEWLRQSARALRRRRYRHVSEHFGFTTVPGLTRGLLCRFRLCPVPSRSVETDSERSRMLSVMLRWAWRTWLLR